MLDSRAGAVPDRLRFSCRRAGRLADPGRVAGGRARPPGRRARADVNAANISRVTIRAACLRSAPPSVSPAAAPRRCPRSCRRAQPDLRAPDARARRAAAPGAPAAAAPGAGARTARWRRCRRAPKPIPTTEHTELRALGKTIARHVDRGFETLVVSTARAHALRRRAPRDGRRGAHPGRFGSAQAVVGLVRQPAGRQRRQQRRERGRRAARHAAAAARARRAPNRARLPPAGVQRRARALSLRAARRRIRTPPIRARCCTGPTLSRATSRGSAWGEFAIARVRELYPEPAPKAVADPPIARDAGHGKKPRRGQEGNGASAKPAKAAPGARRAAAPRVTAPRREPSELARLMDTTTGMTSLQETLQTDRALLAGGGRSRDGAAVGAEAAVVQAAPVGGDDRGARPPDPVRAARGRRRRRRSTTCASAPSRISSACARSWTRGIAPALAGMGEGADYDLAARYEAELGLRQGPLTKLLGPTVVDDLAVVGSDPYLREGSDLTFVFRVRARPAFEAALAGTLAAFGAAHGGLKSVDDRSPGDADHHHAIERRGGAPPPRDRRRVRRRVEQPGGDQARDRRRRRARAAPRRRARLSLHAGARRGDARPTCSRFSATGSWAR